MQLITQSPSRNFAVGTSLGDVGVFDVKGAAALSLQLTNVGAYPLTAFEVHGRVVGPDSGPYVALKTSGYLVASNDLLVIGATADPVVLAAGGSAVLYLDVSMLESIKIRAAAGTATTLAVAAGAYED